MTAWLPTEAPTLAAAERRWTRAQHGCRSAARRQYERTVEAELRAEVEAGRLERDGDDTFKHARVA